MTVPREFQIFGEDYGTSDYKFGPATLGNTPDIVENRGYFPDTRSLLLRMYGPPNRKLLVVGPEVATFVEARRDLAERMVYPMRNGVIDYDDERAWLVVKEITRYGLLKYLPSEEEFDGFKCVAALSAAAPRYMYEKIFDIHREINEEEGKKVVKAVTIIPQPLAVAIAQKAVTCTVLEGGHGNSVPYDEPIILLKDGKLVIEPIGRFVDEYISKRGMRLKDGTEYCLVDNDIYTLSFSPYSLKVSFRRVQAVYRHPSPPILFLVRTRSGREVTVTEDHNLYVLRDGILRLIRTAEVKPGDYIPIPRAIDHVGTRIHKINLLEIFGYPSWLYVKATGSLRRKIKRYMNDKKVSSILGRDKIYRVVFLGESIRADKFREIMDCINMDSSDNLLITARGGKPIKNTLRITDEFLLAAGVYLSEGYRHGKNIAIGMTRCRWLDLKVKKFFRRFASVTHRKKYGDYIVNNLIISKLFFYMFGDRSENKRIPSEILSLPIEKLSIFLKAYFEGDGYAPSTGIGSAIGCITKSRELAHQLSMALLRFGIISRIRPRKIKSKNQASIYYEVAITGSENIEKFVKNIGFASKRKINSAKMMISKNRNTNVDVVPCNPLLRLARADASSKRIAEKLGVGQRYYLQYEEGKYRPSRDRLLQLVQIYKTVSRSNVVSWLETLAKADIFWDEVEAVLKIPARSQYVYDISCPENETFLAGFGGVFVHNTQIAPISRGVIFSALITLNRGGSNCDYIAAEILKDSGYSDLAKEPKLVKLFKETVGVVPRDLKKVLENKDDPRFRVVFRIPNTRIIIDLGDNSWQRFLIGEHFFNPGHEIFQSYYRRGFPKPLDTHIEGKVILGTTDLASAMIEAVSKCSFEVQPLLYRNVILSGGAFAWKVPEVLKDYAVDASTKFTLMLEENEISGVKVTLTKNPVYNVWQGCVSYGLFIPDDYTWDWDNREGWLYL